MIVVDTSAVLEALIGRPVNHALMSRLSEDGDLHAPHLLDVELLHALRRLVRTRRLSDERATEARADFELLTITRYPHTHLADRIWALRPNLTAYDATYVALAEALGAPLVTLDRAMGRARQHHARVEWFGASRS